MTHKSSLKNQLIFKPASQWAIILTVGVTLVTGTLTLYSLSRSYQPQQKSLPTPKANSSAIRAITALGRLEPEGEVIHLSAPASTERSSRVDQLLVKQGDRVRSGQVIAILDSRDRLTAALKQANQQVKIAQARLAQIKAGAKTGEIAAQKATISRLEAESYGQEAAQRATIARLSAELSNAKSELRRYQQLYQNGVISASNIDSKRLTVETIQQQINEAKATLNRILKASSEQTNEAKATLNRIAEVRFVDVQEAQVEVDSAIAAVERAQTDLNLAYVQTPIDSQILKIHTRPGEVVGDKGIADLGRTDQMYVVAEIYETDVGKVHLGQQATITSKAFAGQLRGNVAQIGLQVDKKDVLNTDPAADVDARVVEVKIRLNPESSKLVAGLTRLQVNVAIDSSTVPFRSLKQ